MAKFHNYYVLCPLIDQKSFLGVSTDKDEDCVIVTLGRNVVNKYRLSDQKQIAGWTSKIHITSAVIYDAEPDNYVGVFNNNFIKTWKEDATNLDKVKKIKFPLNILKLIPRDNQSPLVIFSNGNCSSLSYAIENRKTYEGKPLVKETETVVDVASYTHNNENYICYIVKNNKDAYEIVSCPVKEELGDLERAKLNKIKITRDDVYVVGKLICVERCSVYVLWNDSKMTVYNLIQKTWNTVGNVPWISTQSSVSLAWLGKSHLILFGSNMDQDGAIIVAYNITLGVGSCRYPMKMYTEEAKLYCLNSRIILETSNHIGVLPYILETKRNLSNLMGSHEVTSDEVTEIADWGTPTTPQFHVDEKLKDLIKFGLSERNMCAQIIPPLLEKDNFQSVIPAMRNFTDIPESVLVAVLKYAIKLVNPNNVDVADFEKFSEFCKENNEAEKKKIQFLSDVLLITFSDSLIIRHLRNGLNLDDSLFLLSYITYLIVTPNIDFQIDYESKLYDWCILLMDAFYQQYLMTKDEKVKHVLQNVLDVTSNLIEQLENISGVMAQLNKLLSGKLIQNNEERSSYVIELMEI
ncbi:hypothetical protein O3G_MSEX009992 [Manduca sexta]|uniref:Nucleolar protein 11 n=1 Tax=Manduca sexta TaxID=7130 RepID=A0A922CST4_MANSE|nr:hypothetical protein O3G_MSEX009992 [Manduca sexta]